jgi:peptidoglycan hydrolase-like protein with peptidoglycan-binding domain
MAKTLKNSFVGLVAAVFVFAAFATPAKAQTVAELQAMVNQLMAQIAAMSGGNTTSATCYVHSTTLRQGSTGSQVMALQKALGITADGSFGPMTASAVRSFQSSKGLVADGIVGPTTGSQLANACTPSTGGNNGSTGSMDLEGTDGTINDVQTLSQYSGEEVGEGESDVIVLGLEVEASNDGDIMLNSMRVSLDPNGNTGSDNLDDYIDEVTVWFGDKQVGSADADDFSQGSNDIYTRTISLSGVKIEADETEKLYVAVSAVNNLDSGDISTTNDSWTVGVDNIRFTDGSGVVTTESAAGDLPVSGITMDFVDFGTAADTEFKISKDSDSPEAGIVIVDDEDGKDEVTLLMGKFRLTGNSDVVLDEMPVTFTVGGGYLLSDMASSLTLVIDGEEYSESSTTTSGGATSTIVFDNLDLEIGAGDSVEFEVLADINGTDEFAEGGTLLASITSDNRSAVDLENEEGDQVADSDKTGTAIGEAQEFRSEGVAVTLVGTPTAVTGGDNSTTGTYTIKFKVEAVGDDVYVGTVANSSKYSFAVQDSTQTATTGGVSAVITNQGGNGNSTSTTSGGNWKINEGTSASFTLTLSRADGAAGLFRGVMTGLYWTTSDTDAVTTSDNNYTSNMEDFVTDFLTLN